MYPTTIPETMQAIVFDGEKAVLEKNVPVPKLGKDTDLLVKVKAVAGNPTDWKHIEYKIGPKGCIVGCDLSGIVVKVGSKVDPEKFKVGDEVCSFVHGCAVLHPENGAFAEYSVVSSLVALKLENLKVETKDEVPEGPIVSFESAASLPVALYTAAVASTYIYHNKIEIPTTPNEVPQNGKDSVFLIWGGATSVGQNMIQVLKHTNAYSKIIVVASKKHEKLLKEYGATELFDYHEPDVVSKIKAKYPNIHHALDTVSIIPTFNDTYRVVVPDEKSIVGNLMNYTSEMIDASILNDKVCLSSILLYSISGEEIPFANGSVIPKNPEFVEIAVKTMNDVNKLIYANKIKHMPLKIFHNGLEDIPEILHGIQIGKNSGVKFIASI
ncbi:uncharacterized protein SCODWIG_02997 [Saccharomycodes ludwigii]|uniref:Enoyl reductase (ER) domain-containing protein n=1 Tax=Saccharomycodes ludwigii TaxID=36035 RepID=A0A376B983_9ASCO|nr:hypothetical protein SCDLUD_002129 [Saccharomycodes ludwigii]KAH3902309.1 hypothetical protein SCDLUD_002129 [Saccharomycodes ludwigii]SSD61236.1 uncharacterized protein SCODWIG_02997 [Saccharomycodes ludwigii]